MRQREKERERESANNLPRAKLFMTQKLTEKYKAKNYRLKDINIRNNVARSYSLQFQRNISFRHYYEDAIFAFSLSFLSSSLLGFSFYSFSPSSLSILISVEVLAALFFICYYGLQTAIR